MYRMTDSLSLHLFMYDFVLGRVGLVSHHPYSTPEYSLRKLRYVYWFLARFPYILDFSVGVHLMATCSFPYFIMLLCNIRINVIFLDCKLIRL